MFSLEHFQFETRCISNHTACRVAEKTRFFRSFLAGQRSAAASRFTFFNGETLLSFRGRIAAAAGIRAREGAGRRFGTLAAAAASACALDGSIGLVSDKSHGSDKAKSDDQGIHTHGKTSCGDCFFIFSKIENECQILKRDRNSSQSPGRRRAAMPPFSQNRGGGYNVLRYREKNEGMRITDESKDRGFNLFQR